LSEIAEILPSVGRQDDGFLTLSCYLSWLVPQRLTGFEGESDTLLRFAFAAEGEEGFAFEIEKVLLGDEASWCDAAST
jgi:hypothetical protein